MATSGLPEPTGTPGQDHSARDGNAMTGYDQSVALDGDASNQASTVFAFDGNAMTAPEPTAPSKPSPGLAPPRPKPAPPQKAPPSLKPKPMKKLEAAPERNPEKKVLDKIDDRPESPKLRPRMPSPFRAPKPRPPR